MSEILCSRHTSILNEVNQCVSVWCVISLVTRGLYLPVEIGWRRSRAGVCARCVHMMNTRHTGAERAGASIAATCSASRAHLTLIHHKPNYPHLHVSLTSFILRESQVSAKFQSDSLVANEMYAVKSLAICELMLLKRI